MPSFKATGSHKLNKETTFLKWRGGFLFWRMAAFTMGSRHFFDFPLKLPVFSESYGKSG